MASDNVVLQQHQIQPAGIFGHPANLVRVYLRRRRAMPGLGVGLKHLLIRTFNLIVVQRLFHAIAQAILAQVATQFGVVPRGDFVE